MKGRIAAARLASWAMVFVSLLAVRVGAVPSAGQLQPANNYGTVSASLVSSSGGNYTYLFTVTNTTSRANPPYYGIKGVLVYGPFAPIAMSQPSRTQTTLWQAKQGYSWWDMEGSADTDGDCLPDHFLEPGQIAPTTRPDLRFTLTYNHAVDLSQLSFGLHIQVPCGSTFFAGSNPSISGTVLCAEPNGTTHPLPGVTVKLLNANTFATVATTTTDANGNYTFSGPAAGDYLVEASAPDYITARSNPFHYSGKTSVVVPAIQLQAAPVNFRVVNSIYGQVYFSDAALFRNLDSGRTLGPADLFNKANANPAVSYKYSGTIPSFPELGTFSSTHPIWVIIQHELQPETKWVNFTFTNVVGVQSGYGTGANRTPGPYTTRFLCSLPCDGPATAHKVHTTKLVVQHKTTNALPQDAPVWSDLPTVTTDGGISTQAAPAPGDLPPGWMGRTRFEIQTYPGVGWIAWATVQYQNVCGDTGSTVTVDPLTPPAP